jgi:hypothetical protein
MNSFNPNYFIHAANVLLLVAYSVRERLFAVAAALISIPFYVLQPTTLWRLSSGVLSLRPSISSSHGVFSLPGASSR